MEGLGYVIWIYLFLRINEYLSQDIQDLKVPGLLFGCLEQVLTYLDMLYLRKLKGIIILFLVYHL